MEVLAVIPARSGSKGLKDKNIRLCAGKPLIAYSIEQALNSKLINRTIVSTDSEKYANIAREFGAETPFLRPMDLASDHSLDIDVFKHALAYLQDRQGYRPDIVVQLRPTYPIRKVEDIDAMIKILIERQDVDSVRTISLAQEIPYKMWKEDGSGYICPITQEIPEAYNMPRQKLPTAFYQTASIDVIRSRTIMELNSMSGKKIAGYKLNHNFDIDTEDDFIRVENALKVMQNKNTFIFDIDGVIATIREDLDYSKAGPNRKNISIINKLYEADNTIILFTARGYKTGYDWQDITREQLKEWGVKFDQLLFGKPSGDFYIDDKMLGIDSLNDLLSLGF